MQESLSQGTIGRVMVDRNTAFHFLDKSGLKRNRQLRMIRNIDYPMEYYLAHVSHDVMGSPNHTNDSDDEDRDFLIFKNLISISSSSFSIRLIFDPQFFCFFFESLWSWSNFFGSPFKLTIIYAWFR